MYKQLTCKTHTLHFGAIKHGPVVHNAFLCVVTVISILGSDYWPWFSQTYSMDIIVYNIPIFDCSSH